MRENPSDYYLLLIVPDMTFGHQTRRNCTDFIFIIIMYQSQLNNMRIKTMCNHDNQQDDKATRRGFLKTGAVAAASIAVVASGAVATNANAIMTHQLNRLYHRVT